MPAQPQRPGTPEQPPPAPPPAVEHACLDSPFAYPAVQAGSAAAASAAGSTHHGMHRGGAAATAAAAAAASRAAAAAIADRLLQAWDEELVSMAHHHQLPESLGAGLLAVGAGGRPALALPSGVAGVHAGLAWVWREHLQPLMADLALALGAGAGAPAAAAAAPSEAEVEAAAAAAAEAAGRLAEFAACQGMVQLLALLLCQGDACGGPPPLPLRALVPVPPATPPCLWDTPAGGEAGVHSMLPVFASLSPAPRVRSSPAAPTVPRLAGGTGSCSPSTAWSAPWCGVGGVPGGAAPAHCSGSGGWGDVFGIGRSPSDGILACGGAAGFAVGSWDTAAAAAAGAAGAAAPAAATAAAAAPVGEAWGAVGGGLAPLGCLPPLPRPPPAPKRRPAVLSAWDAPGLGPPNSGLLAAPARLEEVEAEVGLGPGVQPQPGSAGRHGIDTLLALW